ncbi:peptidase M16 domain protein [Alkalidesulfovibrio alkalitolerans DSM 16529]|jgi:predicted Zn-dependent peptidase|uniref:Peptidase M16 domain protein n=1 Tax=Alkalidesulfovibrio alkalitolerans DSM 16529 TaxID=1121439 RepID=S7UGX1_9BACT|nr:pitrilysin family protein [Alkalidesulfovibrio alkalitolerans]EPR31493.1 peptidase M16 domain protein [Alkalidesulfovibrio alkalitolerans DSM 16529]
MTKPIPIVPPETLGLTRLENGLRVIVEPMPHVHSASVGIWITSGSRQEDAGREGAAHLWEHMAFKGTPRRSALELAMALDRLGGLSNAFTGREETCFHARVVDSGLHEAFDILSDMVVNPLLDETELELEKNVILQEIAAVEETPEEFVFEHFWQAVWRDPAVAHPILGTEESVRGFTIEGMRSWREQWHRPERIIVSAAGAVDPAAFTRAAARLFERLESGPKTPQPTPPLFTPRSSAIERDVEQSHVILAFPSVGLTHDSRYTVACLSALLGGQMSSRLFQEVREKRGLAYTISTSPHCLTDCGLLEVYAAASPDRTGELLDVLRHELRDVAEGGITEEEVSRAKDHLGGLVLLGAESTEERMLRQARNVALHGRPVSVEEAAGRIAAVSLDDVREAAASLSRLDEAALFVLGPRIDPSWAKTFDTAFDTP